MGICRERPADEALQLIQATVGSPNAIEQDVLPAGDGSAPMAASQVSIRESQDLQYLRGYRDAVDRFAKACGVGGTRAGAGLVQAPCAVDEVESGALD